MPNNNVTVAVHSWQSAPAKPRPRVAMAITSSSVVVVLCNITYFQGMFVLLLFLTFLYISCQMASGRVYSDELATNARSFHNAPFLCTLSHRACFGVSRQECTTAIIEMA